MKQEKFEQQAREAAKAMLKKKAPTKPDTQFVKGAMWAWELLMEAKAPIYYEEKLRAEVTARLGEEGMRENEGWIESLIEETAEKMARLDTFKQEVEVHMKELDRTIGMQREHLGLSFKVNPIRMKESPKQADTDKDPMYQFVKGRKR